MRLLHKAMRVIASARKHASSIASGTVDKAMPNGDSSRSVDARSEDYRLAYASGWFNREWYLRENADVSRQNIDALEHYLGFGGFEGRCPSPPFDSAWYLERYPDVAASGINPLLHYLRYGAGEGRSPNAMQRDAYSVAKPPDRVEPAAAHESHLLPADRSTDHACMVPIGEILAITAACPLGSAGDTIVVPFDEVVYPHVVANSAMGHDIIEFLEPRIDLARRYAVLDIGANIGLVSRQIALRFPNIKRFFCVEPDPRNFRALQYNVADVLHERGSLWNVALSNVDGQASFFRDTSNVANFSLNADAMRDRTYSMLPVRTVDTARWMSDNIVLDTDERLIWKSDTQGHDELIVSLTPTSIWDRIDLAIIELWRIKKPEVDRPSFCRRIEAFPNKSLGLRGHATIDEILTFLGGDDFQYTDLYLWR